jgi:16S rRNA (adenine1518-N6/adenine1519-N6)-dimethyltransferase
MKRPFGQNFLFDHNILRKIVDCGDIYASETVVEIGPGLGTLTRFISEQAERVIAIEFDKKLIGRLTENLSGLSNVEIITADALKYPYDKISGRFKVVANIPYYITTPLFFRLLEFREKIISMTLLIQKEVAVRMAAPPGSKDYGVLSISTQFYTKPELRFMVSRKAFSPPPSVDSAVVHYDIPTEPIYITSDVSFFFTVVKSAFMQRRKMLSNSLSKFNGIREGLDEAGIDRKKRPEELSIEDFTRLADALYFHYNNKRQ